MAIHELYLGGPVTRSYGRSMFPSAPFDAAHDGFTRMRVSAHDPISAYTVGRTFDTRDPAIAEYLRIHPLTAGDTLRLLVLPAGILVRAIQYQVTREAGVPLTLTGTFSEGGVTLPPIDATTQSRGYVQPGDPAWLTTSGLVAGSGMLVYAPTAVNFGVDSDDLGDLRFELSLLVDSFYRGDALITNRGIVIRE